MFGHGTFIYDPREAKAKHGTWDGVAKAIAHLDMSHAWIRTHDKDGLWCREENKELQTALRAHGIKVFAWGWCDGNNVAKDLANVESTLSEYSPDGYIADIEHGVKGAKWTTARITEFCSKARRLIVDKVFIVSTFGFLPSHEPHFMKAAEPHVDAFAPQVYWFWFPREEMFEEPGADGQYRTDHAADYARLCVDVWEHVVAKPLVLTGQAYWGEAKGWTQANAERKLSEFIDEFEAFDRLAGLNWWHLAGRHAMSAAMTAKIAAAKLGSRVSDTRPSPDRGFVGSGSWRR